MVLNIYGYVTVKFDALLRGAVALGCLYSRNGWIAVPQDISDVLSNLLSSIGISFLKIGMLLNLLIA